MRTQVIRNRISRRSRVGAPGIALVLTLLLVGLISVMALTLVSLSSSDFETARNESLSIQAGHNADAGLEEAKMRLSLAAPATITWQDGTVVNNVSIAPPLPATANWRAYILSGWTQADVPSLDPCYGKAMDAFGGCGTTTESTTNYHYYSTIQDPSPTGCGSSCDQVRWGWARIQYKVDSTGSVVYRSVWDHSLVTASTWSCGASTLNNIPVMLVTSEGLQRLPTLSTQYVRRQVQLTMTPQYTAVLPCSTTPITTTTTSTLTVDPFSMGVHAKGTVELKGNGHTDSYDSRLGGYGGSNKGKYGDVSSDADTGIVITILSNATVQGKVLVGPGGSDANISNSGTIDPPSGIPATGKEAIALNMPLPTIPSGVVNSGALKLTKAQTYAGGTYWFSSIDITGNGKLTFTGPAVVYVTGDVNIAGNGTGTMNNLPPNLIIYGTQDPNNPANKCTSIDLAGNGDFYGAVYAPQADLKVSGNGTNYGALTGKTVAVTGNGDFHYDLALGHLGEISQTITSSTTTYSFTPASGGSLTGYQRFSWREVAF